MQFRNAAELLFRRADTGKLLFTLGNEIRNRTVEDRVQDVLLALEIEITRSVCNSRFTRDIGHFRIEKALICEHLYCRAQNSLAFVSDHRAGSRNLRETRHLRL